MTHQEAITKVLTAILSQGDEVIQHFCLGNPFDKLLRSHDEFTSEGKGLYRRSLGSKHYRMSKAAYDSGMDAKELYGEHRIPLKIIIKRLIESDRTYESVRAILASNEVVLIMPEEQKRLDSSLENGGLGLKSKLPPDGSDRLSYAGIEIAPETIKNCL